MSYDNIKELHSRMARIESKLVRGFEELGVNITTSHDWLSVDDQSQVVYLSTLGRSLMVIISDMSRRGATKIGKEYTLVHQGNDVGSVVFTKITM
tara:strand:- start:2057 stop:2341 length:285 start_codon:yes stop_codon:yes gene_type:complete